MSRFPTTFRDAHRLAGVDGAMLCRVVHDDPFVFGERLVDFGADDGSGDGRVNQYFSLLLMCFISIDMQPGVAPSFANPTAISPPSALVFAHIEN